VSQRTISEALVRQFFSTHGVQCRPVPTRPGERTPDFVIELAEPVVCEVKQLEPNKDDRADLATVGSFKGRWVPNRFRNVLKRISPQLRQASEEGNPTLLLVYDATPLQLYSDDLDVLQAMFGSLSVDVWQDANGTIQHGEQRFGKDAGMTRTHNTSVSAVGMLRRGRDAETLTLFHNSFARVPLRRQLFDKLPVTHKT
jgi:hypothetical protein